VAKVWNAYFGADDVDRAIATIEDGGGSVTVPPREVPAGRFAVVADPQGAVLSLFEGELDP
jgi:uncharacterized protein